MANSLETVISAANQKASVAQFIAGKLENRP
jgi:hypothetical protein